MRTVPPGSEAAWRSGAFAIHVRLTVGGVDLSNLAGLDWVYRVKIQESIDQDVATCDFEVVKQQYDLSLSPFLDGSKLNQGGVVIDVGKSVTVEVAVTSPGEGPRDWVLRFSGFIDEIEFAGPTIQCKARDKGGKLQDTFIEELRVYGSGGGTAMEDVIQAILDDNGTGVTLYSANGTSGTPFDAGDSPGFAIRPFKQSKMSVMEAVQALATLIGWDCRYRWNEDTADFQLTLYEPPRSKTTPDWEFDAGTEYRDVSQLAISVLDVRNAFKGVYSDIGTVVMTGNPTVDFGNSNPDVIHRDSGSWLADGFEQGHKVRVVGSVNNDGEYMVASVTADELTLEDDEELTAEANTPNVSVTTGLRTTVRDEDAVSIAKYGRRYMEITESSTSQIDSLSEMKALLAAAKSDLSEPTATVGVTLHSLPWAELGDLWGFAANGEHFDTDQVFAPVTIEHSFNPGGDASTSATLRGKVSGGVRRWIEREGGRGVAPAIDDREDDAASNVTATPHTGSIIVTFDDPRAMSPPISDWLYTEVHVSTDAGFTPTAATFRDAARATRFEIGGLAPRTTYYAKCIHVDEQGNRAAISAQVAAVTQAVGPYHENNEREGGPVNPNPNFAVFTFDETTEPPDFWEIASGLWSESGEGQFYFEASEILSGNRGLRINEWTSPGE